jgi:hypothetical protein
MALSNFPKMPEEKQQKTKELDSAMHKHKQNEHEGEEIKYRMEITNKFRDPFFLVYLSPISSTYNIHN